MKKTSPLAQVDSPSVIEQYGSRLFALMIALGALIQFHSLEIFSRKLILLDDLPFIGPIGKFGFVEYFTKWLFQKDHLAFPLRDFTFWVDFRLADLTGIQFFWISNYVFFAITLGFLLKMGRLLFPKLQELIYFFIALIAFHPTTVEVIQWASMRKHILVGLCVSIGTFLAVRLRVQGLAPTLKNWKQFFAVYLLGLCCYPTGMLWIFWVAYLFRKDLKQNRKFLFPLMGVAGVVLLLFLIFVMRSNAPFTRELEGFLTLPDFIRAMKHGITSLGRGFFNLVFPLKIGPYYTPGHLFAWLGLAGLLYFSGFAIKYLKRNAVPFAGEMLWLSLACIIPSCYIIFSFQQFVWADHYSYISLPYLLFGVGLVFYERIEGIIVSDEARNFGLVLLVVFALRSWMVVPSWKDDLTIMDYCAKSEGSPRCIALAIEKSFDRSGCPPVMEYLKLTRNKYAGLAPTDYAYESDVPFYDGLCAALVLNISPKARNDLFNEVRVRYGDLDILLFSAVLTFLENQDVKSAMQFAFSTYLKPGYVLKGATEKFINVYRGQAQALCDLPSADAAECRKRNEQFLKLYESVPLNEGAIHWGLSQTLSPFFAKTGK